MNNKDLDNYVQKAISDAKSKHQQINVEKIRLLAKQKYYSTPELYMPWEDLCWDLEPEDWTEKELADLNYCFGTYYKDAKNRNREHLFLDCFDRLKRTKTLTQICLKGFENSLKVSYRSQRNKETHRRVGTTKMMNNGLTAQLIRYYSTYLIDVKYEDGVIVNGPWKDFNDGTFGYPGLPSQGSSEFYGFTVKKMKLKTFPYYYKCECKKCGQKDILMAKQIMEHICR